MEKFELTDKEISKINTLVNEMRYEPVYVSETGTTIRKLKMRNQKMELYVSIREEEEENY